MKHNTSEVTEVRVVVDGIEHVARIPDWYNNIYESAIILTPKRAQEYLSKMPLNRNPRRWHLFGLKRLVERDEFIFQPHGLVFDIDDNLIDGQHRCKSVIETGIPIVVHISCGWPIETIFVLDRGRIRTMNDVYIFKGEKDVTNLTPLVKCIWRFASNPYGDWIEAEVPGLGECDEILAEHRPEIERAVMFKKSCNDLKVNREGSLCFFLFTLVDVDACDEFVKKLSTGAGLDAGDPILALRTYLLRNPGSRSLEGIKRIYAMIKAWNSWRNGKALKLIRFPKNLQLPRVFGLNNSLYDVAENEVEINEPDEEAGEVVTVSGKLF